MTTATTEHGAEITGYDIAAVEQWVARHIPQLQAPFTWARLPGGHSNLTCQIITADGQRLVIRRPPMGTLLPKAHDMAREWSAIAALGRTRVPVAKALGFCEDTSVTGAHFYVMSHVQGHTLHCFDDVEQWVRPELRVVLGHSFIDVLADLHALDPDTIGLGALSKRDSYVTRQLNTWYRSWNASIEDSKLDDSRMHTLQRYFQENIPEQGPARVVHGDYGLHNTLVGADGTVAAVVDWELAALGDPLSDLAFVIGQWYEPDDPPESIAARVKAPTLAPGFPTRQQMASRYGARTGRDLSRLDFYIGFNYWRIASQAQGVMARYMAGKKKAEGFDMAGQKRRIATCLTLAEAAVERLESGCGRRWGDA